MGCSFSSAVSPMNHVETPPTSAKADNMNFVVEIAGMDDKDIEYLVERKEIVQYRVVTLKTEMDRCTDILEQLENPKIYQQKLSNKKLRNHGLQKYSPKIQHVSNAPAEANDGYERPDEQ